MKIAYGTSASADDMEEDLADHDNIIGTDTSVEIFTVPEDGVYYFGFNAYSDANQNTLYLDDIEITFAPTCIDPTDLELIDVQAHTAEISWTPGDDETEWEVKYGPTGFDVETEGESLNTEDDAEATLTDLDSETTYDVYVRSICENGNEESEWSTPLTFTTPCTAATVPFLQDFEDVAAPEIPICGTVENAGSGNNWVTYDPNDPFSYTSAEGFDGKVLSYQYDLNNDANAWYFTQGVELEAGVNYEISYKYGNGDSSGAEEKFKVNMGTSASSSAMETELADHPQVSEVSAETNSLI